MKRFVEGENRQQMILLPDCLDDYVVEDNPVRVIDVFIDELDLAALGFEGMLPAIKGASRFRSAPSLTQAPASLPAREYPRRLHRGTQRSRNRALSPRQAWRE
jgi:hypothetical protein